MVKDLEKSKEIDEDESHRGQKSVQDLTDDFCGKVDEAAQKKEQEIMTV